MLIILDETVCMVKGKERFNRINSYMAELLHGFTTIKQFNNLTTQFYPVWLTEDLSEDM